MTTYTALHRKRNQKGNSLISKNRHAYQRIPKNKRIPQSGNPEIKRQKKSNNKYNEKLTGLFSTSFRLSFVLFFASVARSLPRSFFLTTAFRVSKVYSLLDLALSCVVAVFSRLIGKPPRTVSSRHGSALDQVLSSGSCVSSPVTKVF